MSNQKHSDSTCGSMQWNTAENISLFESAQYGNFQGLKDALDKGANPDYFYKYEEGNPSSLHASVKIENEITSVQCTKLLLESGADVNAKLISNKNSALHDGMYL